RTGFARIATGAPPPPRGRRGRRLVRGLELDGRARLLVLGGLVDRCPASTRDGILGATRVASRGRLRGAGVVDVDGGASFLVLSRLVDRRSVRALDGGTRVPRPGSGLRRAGVRADWLLLRARPDRDGRP